MIYADDRPIKIQVKPMNKDMENTFNLMAELGGSDERLGANTTPIINAPLRHNTSKPCGGCGATIERERCIGCMHDFGTAESAWVRAMLNASPLGEQSE